MKERLFPLPPLYYIKKYALLLLGCLCFAASIAFLYEPIGIPAGGVSGLALLINHFFPRWDTSLLFFAINVPLLILAIFALGWRFATSTIISTALSSLLIYIFGLVRDGLHIQLTQDPLLGAVMAGALFGIGVGFIFRSGASTGGTDILVKLLRQKFRHVKTGIIALGMDVVIITASCFIRQDISMWLYGIVEMVCLSFMFDYVLYANNAAKLVYIITTDERYQSIVDGLLHEIDTGATVVDGTGAYTGNDRKIIMCACKPVLFPKVRDLVSRLDPQAFIIVSSAHEIYGMNFQENKKEEL